MLRRVKDEMLKDAYSISGFVQGEMATLDIETLIDKLEDNDIEVIHELGGELLLEAKRRGLRIIE